MFIDIMDIAVAMAAPLTPYLGIRRKLRTIFINTDATELINSRFCLPVIVKVKPAPPVMQFTNCATVKIIRTSAPFSIKPAPKMDITPLAEKIMIKEIGSTIR